MLLLFISIAILDMKNKNKEEQSSKQDDKNFSNLPMTKSIG
jgi:hypothetical protein